jgi:hypothetical protein
LELRKIFLASDCHVSFRKRGVGNRVSAALPANETARMLSKNIAVMDRKAPVSRGNTYQSSSVYYFDETTLCLIIKHSSRMLCSERRILSYLLKKELCGI